MPRLVRPFGITDNDWPGAERRQQLTGMAQGLFIWAATAAYVIADRHYRNPEAQLSRILSSKGFKNLDTLYLDVLERGFPPETGEEVQSLLKQFLGAVVVVRETVNLQLLSSLFSAAHEVGDDPMARMEITVTGYLGSVIFFPDTGRSGNEPPIRILHQSFVDFLTTPGRCPSRFYIDTAYHHQRMTVACFRCISNFSRTWNQDIPPVQLSGYSASSYGTTRANDQQAPALQYASLHWSNHLLGSGAELEGVWEPLREFLAQDLMSWIEVLCGRRGPLEGLSMIMDVVDLVAVSSFSHSV